MKYLLVTFLLLGFVIPLKAQYGAEFTLGGRLNYVGGGRLRTMDGKTVNLGYTIKGIISPGYFVCNQVALGVNLAYEYMKDEHGHQYTLETVPFLRYYTPHGTLRFFTQLESGYGWGKSYLKAGHGGEHQLWVSTLKPGIFVRIKETMALEASVMSLEYKKVFMKDVRNGHRTSWDKWKYNWLDISFGVVFFFGL